MKDERKSILDATHELLKDPKVLVGVVGLGICIPLAFPSITTVVPIVATITTKCGYIALSGITTYVSLDVVKDIIKK